MNIFLIVIYVISAVLGSTLMKYGSDPSVSKSLFSVPIVGMSISLISLVGISAYVISFGAYVVLLSRFDLSFISPLLLAIVYLILMILASVIFKEDFTVLKIMGCSFILIGIFLVLLKR